jgi:protein O-mannosyl-transferase
MKKPEPRMPKTAARSTQDPPGSNRKSQIANCKSSPPVWLMAVLLVLVTIALYWPATSHDFVNYDDDMYVKDNTHVTSGLTLGNARWAFRSDYAGNWHPVTWLSHMLDCQIFGLNPWGHHLTGALLHALNAGLVFMWLRLMTSATWRSLLVAALFALHPLRVESVAWVSERKDVLSGCFGLLALMAYARYAQGSAISNQRSVISHKSSGVPASHGPTDRRLLITDRRLLFYLLSLFFFALGLMSKPMLVTWPLVMLLLDYWPLGRMQNAEASNHTHHVSRSKLQAPRSTLLPLLVEKIPFFILVLLVSVVTLVAQKHGGAVMGAKSLPVDARAGNALISYGRYLGRLFWPTDLAVYYPHPGQWPLGEVVLAGGLILGITVLLLVMRRRSPVLLVGWLWFLVTLVPVIGLVQVGGQAMADRYTYLPSLGVLILSVWGAYELIRGWRPQGMALLVAGGGAILLCLALTRQQLGYWRDNETLFRHALQVTENNEIAHKSFGDALDKKGQTDEAIGQYQEAIRLKPGYADVHNNLGNTLLKKGQANEAIGHFQEAIRLKPGYANAYNNLGNALLKQGQPGEAIRQYQEAIRLEPDDANAQYNLGNAFLKNGQPDEAIRRYREAIRLNRILPAAYYNLGIVLGMNGQPEEAIRQFQEAIRIKPDYAEAHSNLGTAFYQQGRTEEAIRQYQEALRLKPDLADARRNLDLALATKANSSPPPGPSTNR